MGNFSERDQFETRNELRQWARTLMADREAAAHLNANEKMMTWDRLVEKTEAKGFTGDKVFQEIIDSSTRSRPGVNADLGIDPHNPPPLPPHHGPEAETSTRGIDDPAAERRERPDEVSGVDKRRDALGGKEPHPRVGDAQTSDHPARHNEDADGTRDRHDEGDAEAGNPKDHADTSRTPLQDRIDHLRQHLFGDSSVHSGDHQPLFDGSDLTPADRQALNELWSDLSPEQQRRLYALEPMFGEHAALPVDVCNTHARQAAQDLHDGLIRDIELRRELNGDPMITRSEIDRLRALSNIIESVKHRAGEPDRYLLGFEHDGRSITAVGNPDTATRTVVFVPGTFTTHDTLNPYMERPGFKNWFGLTERHLKPGYMEVSRRIHYALAKEVGSLDVAVVDYQNYHAPQSLMPGAANPKFALEGAAGLRNHVDRLGQTNQRDGSALWVAGHSYGTVVVGSAATGPHGLRADGIINLGSPGLRAGDVSGLVLNGVHLTPGDAPVHTMTRSDDPIHIVDLARKLGLDRHGIGHGLMPHHTEFGGHVWDVNSGPHRDPHNAYFDKGNIALQRIAEVVTGTEPPPPHPAADPRTGPGPDRTSHPDSPSKGSGDALPRTNHPIDPLSTRRDGEGPGHRDGDPSDPLNEPAGPHPEAPADLAEEAARALAEDRQTDCADYLAAELGERLGRSVELPGEPSPSGRPARLLHEEFGVGSERTTHAGIEERLLAEGPGSTALVVTKWSADGAGSHGYLAVNDAGVIRLVDPDGRVSGWPPYWGSEAVSRVAAGFFDAEGHPLTPLRGDLDLRAADEVGDIAALPRRTLIDPGRTQDPIVRDRLDLGVRTERGTHQTPVRETDYGQRTMEIVSKDDPTNTSHPDYQQVIRSERVIEYPVGTHPRWLQYAVSEYHVRIGKNEATWYAVGEPDNASGTATRYYPREVEFIQREVFGRVDRPWAELSAQGGVVVQTGDAGGHMLSFLGFLHNGGPNLFSQDGTFNNTAYRTYENYQNDFVRHGATAEGTITLERDNVDSRPKQVKVDVDIIHEATKGEIDTIKERFSNGPKQQYKRPQSGPQIRATMRKYQ